MWFRSVLALTCAIALTACAQSPATQPVPAVTLQHGKLKALVYTSDAQAGHYRGTRFDWSGMIGRLEYDGHLFWDEWNASEDATGDHDNAVGPALEFGMNSPLGFDEAKPGDGFIKIGVGVLKKPDDGKPYFFRQQYDILDPATKSHRVAGNGAVAIETVSAAEAGGYGYVLNKQISIAGEEHNTLVIACELKNTGTKPIVTDVYNHNFFRPGGRGFEPPIQVMFDQPLQLDPKAKLGGAVEQNPAGDTFTVTKPLAKNVWAPLTQHPDRPVSRTFTLTKGKLRMTVSHDFTPAKYVLYGLPEFIAVEPFMDIKLEPGKSISWTYTYRFSVEP
jgi:hypothetical protein